MSMATHWKRLAGGVTLTLGMLCVLLVSGMALSSRASDQDHNAGLGLSVLQANARMVRNWDCGCPARNTRPSVKTVNKRYPLGYPTRCLKENHSSNMNNKDWPKNDKGVPYPRFVFPAGYPPKQGAGGWSAGDKVPFPGWPVGKIPRSKRATWDLDTLKEYRQWYANNKGKAPGRLGSSAFKFRSNGVDYSMRSTKAKPWWLWQIHHILERMHGGGNGASKNANLVPMYSEPNKWQPKGVRSNQHNEYTVWWNNVTLDGKFMKLLKNYDGKAKDLKAHYEFQNRLIEECPEHRNRVPRSN